MAGKTSPHALPASTWAIVPVKPLRESKSRLANVLTVVQRVDLMATILQRTLRVLSRAQSIDRILVVSADPTVLSMAGERGAMTLDEPGATGLNLAVTRAIRTATANQANAALILPADLPFVQASDVELMIRREERENGIASERRPFMSICADAKSEGTNALFISLPTHFTFHYGRDSFRLHVREAAQRGLSPHIVHAPCLEFDLDTEDDWHKYQLLVGDASVVHNGPPRPHPV